MEVEINIVKDYDMNCENLKRPKEEKGEEEEEIGKLFMGIMGGYKDSVIPDLSEFKSEEGSCSSSKKARIEASEFEHLQKERDRRRKMSENFEVLSSLIPSLTSKPKASREKIVTETTNYIRSLQKEAKRLEELKRSRLLRNRTELTKPALSGCSSSYCKPSVNATVLNDVAFFGVQLPVQMGSLCRIFEVFQKYQAEVFEVTLMVNDDRVLTLSGTFTVGIDGNNVVEKIKEEILVL